MSFEGSCSILSVLEVVVGNITDQSCKISGSDSFDVSEGESSKVIAHLISRETDARHARSKVCVKTLGVCVVSDSSFEVVDVSVKSVVVKGRTIGVCEGSGQARGNAEVVKVVKERVAGGVDEIGPVVVLEKLSDHVGGTVLGYFYQAVGKISSLPIKSKCKRALLYVAVIWAEATAAIAAVESFISVFFLIKSKVKKIESGYSRMELAFLAGAFYSVGNQIGKHSVKSRQGDFLFHKEYGKVPLLPNGNQSTGY